MDPKTSPVSRRAELSHVLQDARGDHADRPLDEMMLLREIDVAECLVANGARVGLDPADVEQTATSLGQYRARLARLEELRR